MKVAYSVIMCLFLLVTGCNSKPTLQKYFVENTEKKDFLALDVSQSILNLDKATLSAEQSNALQSFDKMNILIFKLNDKNRSQFEVERVKVNSILKDGKYQQLMKFGFGKEGASVSYVGSDEHIEEFVFYANKKETGFAVIRVLGKDMNPANIMVLMQILQKSNIDIDQLKPLLQFIK